MNGRLGWPCRDGRLDEASDRGPPSGGDMFQAGDRDRPGPGDGNISADGFPVDVGRPGTVDFISFDQADAGDVVLLAAIVDRFPFTVP